MKKIKSATGKGIWNVTNIQEMLNYMRDVLLQKTYYGGFRNEKAGFKWVNNIWK